MKAWQINEYGPVDVFQMKEMPAPVPREGWILIQIKAFGLNRSELYTRQGHSGDAVTIPRVLGIECVGTVVDGGGTDLRPGQKVAAAMGGMGRKHDGGYAEMTLIPRRNVFPVQTNLSWEEFGSLPETYFTAWGAVREAMDLPSGGSLLIRGGTSAAGLACVSIARDLGCRVLATTRSENKRTVLQEAGVDHILIDVGEELEQQVKNIMPEGVDGVVEFVGIEKSILDSLQCAAPGGTVCMVGFLGNRWDYKFFPWMPSTVKLTLYSSETLHANTHTGVLQEIIDRVERHIYHPHIHRVFSFADLPEAHTIMENNLAAGKLVVRVD